MLKKELILSSAKKSRFQKLFQIILTILFLFFLSPSRTVVSQDFEEWMRQEQSQYEDFRSKQNQAFADMLRSHWKAMTGEEPQSQLEEDKPVEIPIAEPEPEEEVRPVDRAPAPPPPPPPPPPAAPPPSPPAVTDPGQPTVSVSFYGLSLKVPYDPKLKELTPEDTWDPESITRAWEEMSKTDIETSVDFYHGFQKQAKINDWGVARLMYASGKKLFEGNTNLASLYTWFMLIQSGYEARVGYNDNGIQLMVASKTHIFGNPFFRFDDRPFFVASFDRIPPDPERLFTYSSDFPGDLKPLSLAIPEIPALATNYVKRNLSFEFQGETIELEVYVDRNLISFYKYFPQTELDIYFNAPFSSSTASQLITPLKQHLEGRSEKESIHLLLRFVQTAFGYKIDPENFGREKPLFPEETLYYDYSDCEDRAILFSFLVRKLTDLKVIGLRYPGHIATAVRFNETLPGDTVTVQGDVFHVCDPTYINAGPGMAMKAFQNVAPEIISIQR